MSSIQKQSKQPVSKTSAFVNEIQDAGFAGDILSGYADRLINATDNSIYQIMPQLVLAPKSSDDLDLIFSTAQKTKYLHLKFTPRGGGTGTNGQSLNDTVIIDASRYLTKIYDVNRDDMTVRVQPGVVLDDLNAHLKSYGLYFPPHVSPSNRATIGGMVATDASGKGSRIYGKTSDYILDFEALLHDGTAITASDDGGSEIYADIRSVIAAEYDAATKSVPNLPRGVSGYNLPQAYRPKENDLKPSFLFAGSEGTLCVFKEITLRLIPLPTQKTVYALSYDSFDSALRDTAALLEFDPAMIETIDDHIIDLARKDSVWGQMKRALPANVETGKIKAMHFVAFETDDPKRLSAECEIFESFLETHKEDTRHFLGFYKTEDLKEISNIWAIRSKCVGLLGNMDGDRKPIPFVEDTAVPPENMADFIADFKGLLAERDLTCGVFGHADVGCLHVRPVLNLREKSDRKLIRDITDEVVRIVKKHGGILWGEHGKGMRGEYTAELLGAQYYSVMCEIKAIVDPDNRLNPGKVASPDGQSLYKIDRQRMRGQYDRQIKDSSLSLFPKATDCNGNGQCFSTMSDEAMCPSYKITRDRKHSPKGRASLLREWLRLDSIGKSSKEFTEEVHEALSGCLGCKACTHTCPIHVNIPDMKSQFLDMYYQKKRRPVRDYVIGLSESVSKYIAFYDFKFVRDLMQSMFGLVDMPRQPHYPLRVRAQHEGYKTFKSSRQVTDKTVFILQDAFTSFFDPAVVSATIHVIKKMGYEPLLLPYKQSGKSWHVRGFMDRFRMIAGENTIYLNDIAAYDRPIVGLDPSVTLVYRDEYKKVSPQTHRFNVLLLHEWMVQVLDGYKTRHKVKASGKKAMLFTHCTEKSALPDVTDEWKAILKYLGVEVETAKTGCCGMAGGYGHEKQNVKNSKGLYNLSWQGPIEQCDIPLVTGYSCRSQVKRFSEKKPVHPIQLLEQVMGAAPKH